MLKALCLASLLFHAGISGAQEACHNVVLIVADDLGYGDLGCYGSTQNRTPNIDALAADGVRFTDFHSAGPMCTPTRVSILTGCYQQRFGPQFDGALSGKTQRDIGLPHEAITLAEVLKENGHATACFGKWHLGYQPPWLPTDQGFDEFRGLASGDGDFHTHIDRGGREDWWRDNAIEMDVGYTTDLLTNYAVEFIERNQDRSFFLYLPHLAIHFPWQGPTDPPHRQKGTDYTDDKWGVIPDPGNVAPHVKAMIESLDRSVGLIVAALKERQLDEKTLVVFTSDNGGYLTYGKDFRNISSNGTFRGQKGQIYEGGHRVPAIFSLPGLIPPAVTDVTAHSTDLFPTLASSAGARRLLRDYDGTDLTSLLLEGGGIPQRDLFWRMNSLKAVRRGPWKLCINGKQSPELYHLDRDPGEQQNLAGERPELVRTLTEAWNDWNEGMNRSASLLKAGQP